MQRVIVRISKAKTVPATNSRHEFRTEWRFLYKISYTESESVFESCGDKNRGLKIVNDAQFAKYLVDNFGNGRYHLHVFKKKISGWTFLSFDCTSKTRFFQVKKEKSFEQKEKEEMLRAYKRKNKELDESKDEETKKEIKEELEEIESEIEVDDILAESDDKRGKGKIIIFKNVQPVYSKNEYEVYGNGDHDEKNKSKDDRIW